MPKHNGGFYEKIRCGGCWMIWSDAQEYHAHEPPEYSQKLTDDDHPDTGRDLVDALQAGELDD